MIRPFIWFIFLTRATALTTWSTDGKFIVYNETKPYVIRGINWNGIESDCLVPHGMWINSFSHYVDTIQEIGFNSVRTPISYEVMSNLDWVVNDYCVAAEPDFKGLTVSQFLRIYFDTMREKKITVLVDMHTIGGRITEYPYDNYNANYWDTINTWVSFLKEFGDDIFAIELKNEPHGTCTTGDFMKWCNDAIQKIEKETNYKGLYFISGVQYSQKEQSMNHAWGGTFSDLKLNDYDHIFNLERIVLCPHVYGTSVRSSSVEFDDYQVWNDAFGFLDHKLPIVYTEMGGFLVGSDLQYYQRFRNYTQQNGLNTGMYWWTLPSTSIDTGGIYYDDAMRLLNMNKVNFIKSFIPNPVYV